jgi:hypothetical protein
MVNTKLTRKDWVQNPLKYSGTTGILSEFAPPTKINKDV